MRMPSWQTTEEQASYRGLILPFLTNWIHSQSEAKPGAMETERVYRGKYLSREFCC